MSKKMFQINVVELDDFYILRYIPIFIKNRFWEPWLLLYNSCKLELYWSEKELYL